MTLVLDDAVLQVFFRQVDAEAPCWVWGGRKTKKDYGVFRFQGKSIRAHRWAWEALVGPVPKGLVLDHLCRNHPCVNPDHLEPVTWAENSRRGPIAKRNASRTHCPASHEYTSGNMATYDGKRVCLTCRRTRNRERDRHAHIPQLGMAHSRCWLGHELTVENTFVLPDGYPVCATCLDSWGKAV